MGDLRLGRTLLSLHFDIREFKDMLRRAHELVYQGEYLKCVLLKLIN